ncbi:Uncharacterised protein [Mycobacteroides abscessus subsp. abscessus]|nr:Uncharacterised protein [Mycobacteroides abscessus subsp. abscessus]
MIDRHIGVRGGQRYGDSAGFKDRRAALGRLIESDRYIRGAGRQHTEHRGNLVAPLGQLHGNTITRAYPPLPQGARHRQGLGRHIAVGPHTILVAKTPDHRGHPGVRLGEVEEAFMQSPAGYRASRRVDGAPHPFLGSRQSHSRIAVPAVRSRAQGGHRIGVPLEHRGHHAVRER